MSLSCHHVLLAANIQLIGRLHLIFQDPRKKLEQNLNLKLEKGLRWSLNQRACLLIDLRTIIIIYLCRKYISYNITKIVVSDQ